MSLELPPDAPIGSPAGATESEAASTRLSFPVAGVGASAGGLEALEALTERLSADGMAFVIVHLSPDHVSLLTDILKRGTSLRVVTIEDGMPLEPGVIYVAPPNVELSIEGHELRFARMERSPGPRHTIDAFFRSLALAGGPMAVGVILSGAGSDGTLGLRAIKEQGGVTFAQDPHSASQPSMPQSAIDDGCVDFMLTAAEIGDHLGRLGEQPDVLRSRPTLDIDGDAVGGIFALLRAEYGVDFALYKRSTVERRIGRRMALHKIERIEDYLTILGGRAHELRGLYNDLLIGVTNFFRDTEPFDALKNVVFPRLFRDPPTDASARIWVAGCASGEEAYSIAIALLEFLGDRGDEYKIQIFATDVDDDALARARSAVYSPDIELDVSPERLQRFFARTEKGYQVTRKVRDLVVFAHHNLGKDPPFSRLDLVTCRNVLIYLQTLLQKRVLRVFHYALKPHAYLLLGTSESVGDSSDLFSLLERKLKVYVKKDIPSSALLDFPFASSSSQREDGHRATRDPRPPISMAQIADRKVIERYAPPGVIVDERLDIVQFRGRIGQYLEPASGAATLNLLKLARPELLVAIRSIVQKAFAEGTQATSPPVAVRSDSGSRTVTLDAMPLSDAAGRKNALVLFSEAPSPQIALPAVPSQEARTFDGDGRFMEMERELAANKEYLQCAIEELEASNEELQSSNEELQSSNEELQSTNEELETSKEELQSTNEELATVNDELHSRMAQLSLANDDLQNVLLNGSAAMVIIGADLRIRRFSTAAERLLNLIPADVGRPIAYLRNVMSGRDVEQIAAEAMSSVMSRDRRVRCLDGYWYSMRIVPYLTGDQMIRGVVLELVKTRPPAATPGGGADAVHPLAAQVLSTFPGPLMLLDRQLHLIWANRAFFEAFPVGPGALGRPLAEAWGSPSEPPELWAFLEELLSARQVRDILIERPFGTTAEHPMRFIGRVVPTEADGPFLAAVFMQTI
jgi:two-component system CheB/CheR fusion protein